MQALDLLAYSLQGEKPMDADADYAVANHRHAEELMKVIREVRRIRGEVVRVEHSFEHKIQQTHERYRPSARNLLHYLALRQHDIRPLQERLAEFGLSSL